MTKTPMVQGELFPKWNHAGQMPSAEAIAASAAQLAASSPEAARAVALVASLGAGMDSSEAVFAAFAELDALPPAVAREALVTLTGPAPDPEALDAEIRRAHGFPPRALALKTVVAARDADVLDLGDRVLQQLRVAGKSWDGVDREPEERLDGEAEGTFAGTLEYRTLAEASGGAPLFDVFRYAGDSGAIFRAGTTELVGAVAYGTVEMRDRRARVAIQAALDVPAEATPIEEAVRSVPGAISPLAASLPPVEIASKGKAAKKAASKKTAKSVAKEAAVETPKKAASAKASAKASTEAPAAKKSAKKAAETKATKKASTKKIEAASAKKASSKKVTSKKAAVETATVEKKTSKKAAAATKKAAAKVAKATTAKVTKDKATKVAAAKPEAKAAAKTAKVAKASAGKKTAAAKTTAKPVKKKAAAPAKPARARATEDAARVVEPPPASTRRTTKKASKKR